MALGGQTEGGGKQDPCGAGDPVRGFDPRTLRPRLDPTAEALFR